MTLASIPRLTRLRIGPAEQAAGEFLEARDVPLALYAVRDWIPIALAIWGGELEYEAWVELPERGLVR